MKKLKGLTLISLVIVIIITLILTGAIIVLLGGENGVIKDAKKAKIMNELYTYKEQLEYFNACQELDDSDYKHETLNAGKNSLFYNTQKESEKGQGNVFDVIKNVSDEYADKIEIIKGELLLNTKDKDLIEIAKLVNIRVNPYDIVDGVLLSSTGNLLLMEEDGSLTIPETVTKIGTGAFANLEGLKTIIIPGTCKEIAQNAFAYNKTLEKVIIQEGVERIGIASFAYCYQLREVQMTNSVISIENEAFYSCSKLESINLSSKLTELAPNVLHGCLRLTELTLPDGLKTLAEGSLRRSRNI